MRLKTFDPKRHRHHNPEPFITPMSYLLQLSQYFYLTSWTLTSMLELCAAFILFRKRDFASNAMLLGAMFQFACGTIERLGIRFRQTQFGFFLKPISNHLAIAAYLGGFMFGVGLLFVALRSRAQSSRINELEQILAIQQSEQP